VAQSAPIACADPAKDAALRRLERLLPGLSGASLAAIVAVAESMGAGK
jgi:hypothetical protein